MKNSLSAILAKKALNDSTKSSVCQKNRATFITKGNEIRDALANGWTIKAIWQYLHEKGLFPGSYACFRGYVKKMRAAAPEKSKETPSPAPIPPVKKPAGIKSFEYSPHIDKKKLYGE